LPEYSPSALAALPRLPAGEVVVRGTVSGPPARRGLRRMVRPPRRYARPCCRGRGGPGPAARAEDDDLTLSDCDRDCLAVLARAWGRLSAPQGREGLERSCGVILGLSTVQRSFTRLRRHGLFGYRRKKYHLAAPLLPPADGEK